jgi:hypothetical protein
MCLLLGTNWDFISQNETSFEMWIVFAHCVECEKKEEGDQPWAPSCCLVHQNARACERVTAVWRELHEQLHSSYTPDDLFVSFLTSYLQISGLFRNDDSLLQGAVLDTYPPLVVSATVCSAVLWHPPFCIQLKHVHFMMARYTKTHPEISQKEETWKQRISINQRMDGQSWEQGSRSHGTLC